MGEWREGVLVRVLMRVLVLMLVLMELGPQVGRRAQGCPSVGALRGQEARVQFLPQDILFWKRRRGREWQRPLFIHHGTSWLQTCPVCMPHASAAQEGYEFGPTQKRELIY